MKICGWVFLILGILSFIGALSAGRAPIGGAFWAVLGAYLIHRSKQKQEEARKKKEWEEEGEDGSDSDQGSIS